MTNLKELLIASLRETLLNDGYREFTASDWFCWAGCERFKDGSQPLIKEVEATYDEEQGLTIREHILIWDTNTISIYHNDDKGYDYEYIAFEETL